MTLDEALKNAARCLEKGEAAPEPVANSLATMANLWLRMADILLARESSR